MEASSQISKHALQEDFHDFFEEALCGYLIVSPQGKILRSNGRLAKWVGKSAEELIGKRFSDLLAVGGKVFYETHLSPLLRMQGYFDEISLEFNSPEGGRFHALVNSIERRNDDGKPEFVRLSIYRNPDRQTYENNLRIARDAAEKRLLGEREASAIREQFIAVLSHDLRNPLAAITSGVRLIGSSPHSTRDRTIITMMGESASRMAELIENVMDFARARLGGGIRVNLQSTVIEPALNQVVEELRSAYPQRIINTEFAAAEPIVCDAARISQLLSNLLANALTHGAPEGPVAVRMFQGAEGFEMSVSNTVEPIPPASLERLFQPFTREDAHASQNGLGLGLYIASEIARAHKGELTATSTTEETRFTFKIR